MNSISLENDKSWILQPGICRCCLSSNGKLDITGRYINKDNLYEVYYIMIKECFGVSLTNITYQGPHCRSICELCIKMLQAAFSFRKKIIEVESLVIQAYKKKEYKIPNDVKCEDIKEEIEDMEYICMDSQAANTDEEDNIVLHNLATTKKSNKKKKKRRKHDTTALATDNDSDTPISKYITNKAGSNSTYDCIVKRTKLLCNNEDNSLEKQTFAPPRSNEKLLSENKRIMLTCDIVLKDTTACPFRHHKSWFQCFYCDQDFMEITLLREHLDGSHTDIDKELKMLKRYPRSLQIDISLLKCVLCSQSLSNIKEMRNHFQDIHNKVIYNECIADYKVNKSPYICHLCNLEFHVFRSLTTHLNEHYTNCICDVCGKSFMNSKRLKVHKRTHEKGSFPCNECGKVLKSKTSKANHIGSAHSGRVLKCHICSEPMKHYHDRIKHMSDAHGITHKFKCPICSREYNIKHYLATHMRQTHGHKNKTCSECSMAFITNHGLKKHMLKHTGEKPFICEICCKSYARNYTLREHMKTVHENENRL